MAVNNHELKKHTAAIHISNAISLLQRKISNILLLNAYDHLAEREVHNISISKLAEEVGFDNTNNLKYLKDALKGLAKTAIEWNLMDEEGRDRWGVTPIIAHAEIIDGGLCEYSYSAPLRKLLFRPEVFAIIDVRVQRLFQSSHALALYENCYRYKDIGQTPVWPLDIFKRLIIGERVNSSYDDFAIFNRDVIKKAVNEVNNISSIKVEPVLIREKRKVVAVKFLIAGNQQESLMLDVPAFNNALMRRLLDDFEITETQAKEILSSYSEEYIIGNLDIVEQRIRAGKVKEIGPYTLKSLRIDVRIKESRLKRTTTPKDVVERQLSLEKELARKRHEQIQSYLNSLDQKERKSLEVDFIAKLPKHLKPYYQKSQLKSKLVMAEFNNFVADRMFDEVKKHQHEGSVLQE